MKHSVATRTIWKVVLGGIVFGSIIARGFYALGAESSLIDLNQAVIIVRSGERPAPEITAAQVLAEEVEKRTGIRWATTETWPANQPVIVVAVRDDASPWKQPAPKVRDAVSPETQSEGFRLVVDETNPKTPVVWILGADARGTLFGVGWLLRHLEWSTQSVRLARGIDVATAPAYPIRGHQLGYRARANSYDAWSAEQYEQYIRELTFFGVNSVENIPFQDSQPSPLMTLSREEMNVNLSEICERYGLAYWIWAPADFDLENRTLRDEALLMHEALYQNCPRLDAVFFPGGDPGDNHPKLVMPFLADVAERLVRYHPEAKVWISLQGFDREKVDYFYADLEKTHPAWLGGIVAGPSSPPIPETRKRLAAQYGIRHYPDITHNVRCQYPVQWWDTAFCLTLGREACNPRPMEFAHIHNWFAPYTEGFISYSDGIHDDVNKVIWSACGWDPAMNVREILIDYGRVFFGPDVAEASADGILALERNWEGALALNGAVDSTLAFWQVLERSAPQLKTNWRWQLCLLRAYYDAYIRHRLINESGLEEQADAVLAKAETIGAATAIQTATSILNQAVTQPKCTEWRQRIEELCEALFQSIGLQTSMKKYQASGAERGCVLDFVDYPMNNRWWLEQEFKTIEALPIEAQKVARLKEIALWEHPGPGSFYDDVGNIAKSPHVVREERTNTDPLMLSDPNPTSWWWRDGNSPARLSWQTTLDWPKAMRYERLDPQADYVLRMTGYGEALTRVNGERLQPTLYGKEIGEIKEFPIPKHLYADGKIEVTWDVPDEAHLNWRQQSRVAEVWLIKKN